MIGIGINIGLRLRRTQSGRQHELSGPQRQRPRIRMRSRGEDFWPGSWQNYRGGAAAKIEEDDLSVANMAAWQLLRWLVQLQLYSVR